jgi:phenylacetate-CoA ligase
VRGFIRKAQGTAIVARNLIGQAGLPYLPDNELHEIRDRRVSEIVGYAARTVPFYRDFFQSEGIDPAGISCAEDLERLPLIDKQTVREQPERFLSTSSLARSGMGVWTSGTTGMPLQVWHDRRSLLANSAYNRRIRTAIASLLGTGSVYEELRVGQPDSMLNQLPGFLDQNRFMPFPRRHIFQSLYEPLKEVVRAINVHRPEVIACSYGSYLELLFRTVRERGLEMHVPRVLIHYSDAMSGDGTRLIEEEFGIAVVSEYSATEAFKIGFVCEERCGFHCHDDLTHVRIVDVDGRSVPVGQEGEVVISNLVNHGTVLLNYRLGDVAALSDEPCRCGRTLRLLSLLEGRVSDIIRLGDGSSVHSGRVRVACNQRMHQDSQGLLQYQLIQRGMDVFEFRLATVGLEAFDRTVGGFVSDLQAILGPDVTIEALRFADSLPPGPGGKTRAVIADLGRHNGDLLRRRHRSEGGM